MYSLHRISVSLLSIFLSLTASGTNPYHLPAGAAEAGMGSVSVMKNGFWSSFRNQGLLAHSQAFSAGFNYTNRFNIGELGSRTAGMIIPAGRTSLGLIYSHFGFSHFRRETGALGCGLRLSENFSAGIQIDYFLEKASGEYDNFHAVTFEGGLLITPKENIKIGIHVFNPLPNSFRRTFLPSSIRAGAGIELNKNLFTGVEAELSSERTLLIRMGFEYSAAEKIRFRGGFSSGNSSFTFGLGYQFRSIDLDMSFATHEKLGITSSVSMIFKIRDII